MGIKQKMNGALHALMARRVMKAYARKSKKVERLHPELFRPVDAELSRRHRELWSRLGLKSGDRWLRLHVNLTGIEDYTFCPEDVFFAAVERVMNDCNQSGYGPEDKGTLFRFVPRECEPETVVRFVRGSFFDRDLNWIGRAKAAELLKGEFVGKPCLASGGSGVVLRHDFTPEGIEAYAGTGGGVCRPEEDRAVRVHGAVQPRLGQHDPHDDDALPVERRDRRLPLHAPHGRVGRRR